MRKFISILTLSLALLSFSAGAQDVVKPAPISVTEEEVVNFIAAFPEFLQANKNLNPSDPASVTAVMTAIAADRQRWETFAKEKGFAGYEDFMRVSAGVTTAFAYQILQQNAAQLENQIPIASGAAKEKLLKPVKEQIRQYGNMISPDTLEAVKKHTDELLKILIPPEKPKQPKKR